MNSSPYFAPRGFDTFVGPLIARLSWLRLQLVVGSWNWAV